MVEFSPMEKPLTSPGTDTSPVTETSLAVDMLSSTDTPCVTDTSPGADASTVTNASPTNEKPTIEGLITDIIQALKSSRELDARKLESLIARYNRAWHSPERHFAKRQLLPAYQHMKREHEDLWRTWHISEQDEAYLIGLLQMKPRRSASGVATITVITKPHACASACLYCPNDVRMPKSYLFKEPACQRAERNFFDPYLQVASRLEALHEMGHATDKIELIVLGGTWSDYPRSYRIWYARELFRALNDSPTERQERCNTRRTAYKKSAISCEAAELVQQCKPVQDLVNAGQITYNEAVGRLFGPQSSWGTTASWQQTCQEDLFAEHTRNETADHRCVGLVVETRPDAISAESLHALREIGCTKVQIGVQSTRDEILAANDRGITTATIKQAFRLLRVFGFKIHAHFMVNLLGSTPADDKRDYACFADTPAFRPDEVKLYPCALIEGTGLMAHWEKGTWRPYSEDELVDVLTADVLATPAYTRLSRMIRDISTQDIVAGNKKPNLRQMVEERLRTDNYHEAIREIRFREINRETFDINELTLKEIVYQTEVSEEHFLQWVDPADRIAGFLRLSLPDESYIAAHAGELPINAGEAMIREVHVYGVAAHLHRTDAGVQHLGLGRQLVEQACTIAAKAGFTKLNVISAIGTREYYRRLSFYDNGLYQQRNLLEPTK